MIESLLGEVYNQDKLLNEIEKNKSWVMTLDYSSFHDVRLILVTHFNGACTVKFNRNQREEMKEYLLHYLLEIYLEQLIDQKYITRTSPLLKRKVDSITDLSNLKGIGSEFINSLITDPDVYRLAQQIKKIMKSPSDRLKIW